MAEAAARRVPTPLIAIPDLAEKLHLCLAMGAASGMLNGSQQKLAALMEMPPDELSRSLSGDTRRDTPELPPGMPFLRLDRIPAFLRLFGVTRVPARLEVQGPWVQLATASLPAFVAGVEQLGGTALPLASWDRFLANHAHSVVMDPGQGRDTLWLESAAPEVWQQAEAGLDRLSLPPEHTGPEPVAERAPEVPTVRLGDEARIRLDGARAFESLGAPPALHVLLFQELWDAVHERRFLLRLLPRPAGSRYRDFPADSTLIRGAFANTVLLVPRTQRFQVRADHEGKPLSPLRRLVALFTERPLDADITGPVSGDWNLSPDALDVLATRLGGDESRYGNFLAWTYNYRVQASDARTPTPGTAGT